MPGPILVPSNEVTIPVALTGRSIAYALLRVIGFYGKHRASLAPWIDPRLTAILDNLADAVLLVKQIVHQGPE